MRTGHPVAVSDAPFFTSIVMVMVVMVMMTVPSVVMVMMVTHHDLGSSDGASFGEPCVIGS
jgi:hypothetical protein